MLKVLELFGGIGACTKALKRLNIPFKVVDYVEIDKYAVKSYNAMNGTNFEPQDITKWNKDLNVDLIMHGSPCQDFSLSGKLAGGDEGSGTRSSLMFETIRIVRNLNPKYVIWENVRNVISKRNLHNFNKYINYLNELGYTSYYQLLNAKDYGIPQNRQRIFVVSIKDDPGSFEFPKPIKLTKCTFDIVEYEVDGKYYLSEKMIDYISFTGKNGYKNNDCKINLDIARPLTTDPNKRAGTSNYICVDLPPNYDIQFLVKQKTKNGYAIANVGDSIYINRPHQKRGVVQKGITQTLKTSCDIGFVETLIPLKIRRYTPLEYFRLMGFDDYDFYKCEEVNSNTQLYKQAGNSIVVNVLEAIFKELLIENEVIYEDAA